MNEARKECKNCLYYQGWVGESIIRTFLSNRDLPYFQADILYRYNSNWFLAEVKRQERYKPPPFEGHGLPLWQIKRRLEFQKQTGIRAVLFIVEKPNDVIFWNYLDILWMDKAHETSGKRPRVIFPLNHFKEL